MPCGRYAFLSASAARICSGGIEEYRNVRILFARTVQDRRFRLRNRVWFVDASEIGVGGVDCRQDFLESCTHSTSFTYRGRLGHDHLFVLCLTVFASLAHRLVLDVMDKSEVMRHDHVSSTTPIMYRH